MGGIIIFDRLLFESSDVQTSRYTCMYTPIHAHAAYTHLVSRSHTLSKTGEGLVCLASTTRARGMLGMFGLRLVYNNYDARPCVPFRFVTLRLPSIYRRPNGHETETDR